MKAKNEMWITIECEECGGEGYHEIGPECSKPASSCCGGCYREEECKECDEEGHLWGKWDVDAVQSLVDIIFADGADVAYIRSHVKELIKLNQ